MIGDGKKELQMLQVHSRVGKDGILNLAVPLGIEDADKDVLITIQPLPTGSVSGTQKPWPQFLDETYGSCAKLDLQRGPQGDYEKREALD